MKRILCLIDCLGAGGAQHQMVGLAALLKEKGYHVVVCIYHKELFYADYLRNLDIPYVYLEKAENKYWRYFLIERYIRHLRPDVVISYLDVPNICACCSRIFNRKFRVIVSERSTTQKTNLSVRIRFNIFRLAAFVVPNSFTQADYIRKSFPFLSHNLSVIPNFVNLQKFYPVFHSRHQIPLIIIVATIRPLKNTLLFIDAVEILAKRGLKFHIDWYGKNAFHINYFNTCKQKIHDKGLSKMICLLDKTNKIQDCYRDADYFCLPSFYEGTSNAICEALASGLPILCSNVCDNAFYVYEGRNGCLFNPKDAESMANSIEKALLLSDEDYTSYCKNSRSIAENKLSKERFIIDYIQLIEQRKKAKDEN